MANENLTCLKCRESISLALAQQTSLFVGTYRKVQNNTTDVVNSSGRFTGSAYAREALTAVIAWVSSLGVPGADLVAVTQEANARSRRLLEALGATLAERFVEWGESQVLYRLSARA